MHSALSTQHSALRQREAFTLVEVTLAIAVVAIGMVGILALFPLGLRATRTAADDTQMAMVAQDYITYYQQLALTNVNYASTANAYGATGILDATTPTYGLAPVTVDNVTYTGVVSILNDGFPVLTNGNMNLISRITIQIWRPGSKTNMYVTEVARYD